MSYYMIINGYKTSFLNIPGTDNFVPGTKFEQLYTLHTIDISINQTLFKYILYIEQSLKTRISYLVSDKYGVFTDYYDLSNTKMGRGLITLQANKSQISRHGVTVFREKFWDTEPRMKSLKMNLTKSTRRLPSGGCPTCYCNL